MEHEKNEVTTVVFDSNDIVEALKTYCLKYNIIPIGTIAVDLQVYFDPECPTRKENKIIIKFQKPIE